MKERVTSTLPRTPESASITIAGLRWRGGCPGVLGSSPIGLAKFVEAYQTRWELMMAGSVVVALPALLVFLALQRRFLAGFASLSGLK